MTAAAALPQLGHACGLGTGGLFVEDVVQTRAPSDGYLTVGPVTPDPARLQALAARRGVGNGGSTGSKTAFRCLYRRAGDEPGL